MKCLNLQVDNYVLFEGLVIKVSAVHQKKIGYHIYPNKLNWVRYSLIEPISITSDFVYANLEVDEEYTSDYASSNIVFFKVPNHTWHFIYDIASATLSIEDDPLIKIKYVHELQNIFTLLKVKKTITISKL